MGGGTGAWMGLGAAATAAVEGALDRGWELDAGRPTPLHMI
jgi:hypothetical protein